MSAFGDIITAIEVQDAFENTIRMWAPDYLAEVAFTHGRDRGKLQNFRSYGRKVVLEKMEENQLPSCVIMCPGTLDAPIKRNAGVDVRWSVGIGLIVSGQTEENTMELVQLYTAAVRTLLLQKSSLGNFATGIVWLSETYDEMQTAAARTLAAGVLHLGCDVPRVSNANLGPTAPRTDVTQPPEEWPTVATVGTTVTGVV